MKSYLTYLVALAVGLCFISAVASMAKATDYGQQQFQKVQKIQRIEKVVVPQKVIVQERIVQQNVYDPYLSQFSATDSFRIRQEQIIRSRSRQQQFFNSRGNFSSFTVERQSNGRRGGGLLRNLLPF